MNTPNIADYLHSSEFGFIVIYFLLLFGFITIALWIIFDTPALTLWRVVFK